MAKRKIATRQKRSTRAVEESTDREAVRDDPTPHRARRITQGSRVDLPLQNFYSRQTVQAAPISGPIEIPGQEEDDPTAYCDETFRGFIVFRPDGGIVAMSREEFLANYITSER